MPNRREAHPITRVLVHGRSTVYGAEIDGLIREIYALPGGLAALYEQRLHILVHTAEVEIEAQPELLRELRALRQQLAAGTGKR